MIRTPIVSINEYLENTKSPPTLAGLKSDAEKFEAILLASPTLAHSIRNGLSSELTAKREGQLIDSVGRYLVRMSTRPTPFAGFAGVSLGHASIGDRAGVLRDNKQAVRTIARLDFEYLLGVVKTLEEDARVRRELQFFTNPTLYESGGRMWVVTNDAYGQGGSNQTASVRLTPALRSVLRLSFNATPWKHIFESLQRLSTDVSHTTIAAFLDTLWQQGVLLSTLRPPLTVSDSLAWVIDALKCTTYRGEHFERLERLANKLDKYNRLPLGEGIQVLDNLHEEAGFKPGDRQTVIAADTAIHTPQAILPQVVWDDASIAAELVLGLSTVPPTSPALRKYRTEFLERYSEREVPLLELLDEESGLGPPIGYRNPPPKRMLQATQTPTYSDRDGELLRLVGEALYSNKREVVLDDEMLARLQVNPEWQLSAPKSADVFGFIAASSQNNVEAGEYLFIVAPRVGTWPTGRSFGRFAHILPAELTTWMRSRAEDEGLETPGVAYAELVYSHFRGHATNVALRPQVYKYQIAINNTPSVEREYIIDLEDIVVGVNEGRFYAKSKRLQKQVVARSTHLLNFVDAPNVCRFLQEISDDGIGEFSQFDWGPASGLPYLPRIRYGRIVLCVARWRLPRTLVNASKSEWSEKFHRWREHWHLPRYVYLSRADNRLLLDLECKWHVDLLRNEANTSSTSHPGIVIEEALPGPSDAWLPDADGNRYLSEFVFSVERNGAKTYPNRNNLREAVDFEASTIPFTATKVVSDSERVKLPTSDWLYLKLAVGESRQDDVLLDIVEPLKQLGGGIDRWFFIRYRDPDPHIRLRLFNSTKTVLGESIAPLLSRLDHLVSGGLLNRYSIETYDREIERYGGLAGMALSEQLFHLDSETVVRLLAPRRSMRDEVSLIVLGVVSVDHFIRGFGYGSTERLTIYQRLFESQARALGVVERHLSDEYRTVRPKLWEHFRDRGSMYDILLDFQRATAPLVSTLRSLQSTHELGRSLAQITASHIHMHCNRLGVDRHSELKIIYFLSRLYDGFSHHVPFGIEL